MITGMYCMSGKCNVRKYKANILLLTFRDLFFLIFNPLNQNSNLKTVTLYWHSPYNFFPWPNKPPVGESLLIFEASRSYSDTPQSVELLWTSDQPKQITLPDNTQHLTETDICASGGIRTHDPSNRAAADPRLRPRGHWGIICWSIQVSELAINYLIMVEENVYIRLR
jgi:hypothetical protein